MLTAGIRYTPRRGYGGGNGEGDICLVVRGPWPARLLCASLFLVLRRRVFVGGRVRCWHAGASRSAPCLERGPSPPATHLAGLDIRGSHRTGSLVPAVPAREEERGEIMPGSGRGSLPARFLFSIAEASTGRHGRKGGRAGPFSKAPMAHTGRAGADETGTTHLLQKSRSRPRGVRAASTARVHCALC